MCHGGACPPVFFRCLTTTLPDKPAVPPIFKRAAQDALIPCRSATSDILISSPLPNLRNFATTFGKIKNYDFGALTLLVTLNTLTGHEAMGNCGEVVESILNRYSFSATRPNGLRAGFIQTLLHIGTVSLVSCNGHRHGSAGLEFISG